MKMINISENTLRKIGAYQSGDYLRIPVSELCDPAKPESSNDGNYREYAEFRADTLEYRSSMSYHGDIEPMPEWVALSQGDWERELLLAVLAAEKIA